MSFASFIGRKTKKAMTMRPKPHAGSRVGTGGKAKPAAPKAEKKPEKKKRGERE